MTVVSDYTTLHAHSSLVKIIEKHEWECVWFAQYCKDHGIPCWRIGYEWKYGDDPLKYFEIRDSDDFWTRLMPDFKIFYKGKFYLVDLKASRKWLPALALSLNVQREFPVVYIFARQQCIYASEIFQNQIKYLDLLRVYLKKEEPLDRVARLMNDFSVLPFEESDGQLGPIQKSDGEWTYVSGDTCVKIRYDAPFLPFNSLIPQ